MCLCSHPCFLFPFLTVKLISINIYLLRKRKPYSRKIASRQELNLYSLSLRKPPSNIQEAITARQGSITIFKKCTSLVGTFQSLYLLTLFLYQELSHF